MVKAVKKELKILLILALENQRSGYGITDKNIVRKGIISDSEAKSYLKQRILNLHNHLNKTYEYYRGLNPNQKTALISFSYNLGKYFIQLKTEKMHENFVNGNINGVCAEMHDCDNVTQNR
jgi:GH24 family phage-related lysozyme (muramidase)